MKNQASHPRAIVRLIFYAALIAIILWILVLSQNSYLNTWKLKSKMNDLKKEMLELQAVNDSLRQENHRLKTDPKAAEKVARERFGLTKEGEKSFRFIPDNSEDK